MKEEITKIFEIKDIVWFIIGLVLPYLLKRTGNWIRMCRIRQKIRKADMTFMDSGIVSLMHGDPS